MARDGHPPMAASACPEGGHVFFDPPREIAGMAPGAITAIDHETVLRLKQMPYAQVLASARTFDDLKLIAAARGYVDGWVYRAAKELGIAIPYRERGALLRPIPARGGHAGRCSLEGRSY